MVDLANQLSPDSIMNQHTNSADIEQPYFDYEQLIRTYEFASRIFSLPLERRARDAPRF